jgi:hypothetical protein
VVFVDRAFAFAGRKIQIFAAVAAGEEHVAGPQLMFLQAELELAGRPQLA